MADALNNGRFRLYLSGFLCCDLSIVAWVEIALYKL